MDEKLKNALFKLFIFMFVELMCFNFFIIISSITGVYNWTLERLTSSVGGFLVQIINLVSVVFGMIIAVYIIIIIIFLFKGK